MIWPLGWPLCWACLFINRADLKYFWIHYIKIIVIVTYIRERQLYFISWMTPFFQASIRKIKLLPVQLFAWLPEHGTSIVCISHFLRYPSLFLSTNSFKMYLSVSINERRQMFDVFFIALTSATHISKTPTDFSRIPAFGCP